MALYVNTNVSSLNGRNKLENVQGKLNTSFQRLSSGLRINSAKDDAAGLQISDRLTSQVNGLNQGNRNTNDGIAVAQTIEGAMDEIGNMLQRVRTLAVQSSNGTNTDKDRAAIQAEVTQLSEEITRVAEKTTFGGQQVLAGNSNQGVGAPADNKGLVDKNGKIILQVGANAGDTLEITGLSTGFTLSRIATLADKIHGKSSTKALTGKKIFAVSTANGAASVLEVIDGFIAAVDNQRGKLGAMMNRMESTIRNQANISMNTADARSRIRDTDFAEESATLTQNSIVQNAAATMLVQANMKPRIALHLMG